MLDVPRTVHGRRDRVLAGGQQIVVDSLAEKILHGWLQNRHQTLFPLTVNLRTMRPDQTAAVARWTAVAALATRPSTGSASAMATARDWLAGIGAEPRVLDAFDAAWQNPPPLHEAISNIATHDLAAYAYVAALVTSDPSDPATLPFLDYVAARLMLPTTMVRSAVRRYRR